MRGSGGSVASQQACGAILHRAALLFAEAPLERLHRPLLGLHALPAVAEACAAVPVTAVSWQRHARGLRPWQHAETLPPRWPVSRHWIRTVGAGACGCRAGSKTNPSRSHLSLDATSLVPGDGRARTGERTWSRPTSSRTQGSRGQPGGCARGRCGPKVDIRLEPIRVCLVEGGQVEGVEQVLRVDVHADVLDAAVGHGVVVSKLDSSRVMGKKHGGSPRQQPCDVAVEAGAERKGAGAHELQPCPRIDERADSVLLVQGMASMDRQGRVVAVSGVAPQQQLDGAAVLSDVAQRRILRGLAVEDLSILSTLAVEPTAIGLSLCNRSCGGSTQKSGPCKNSEGQPMMSIEESANPRPRR